MMNRSNSYHSRGFQPRKFEPVQQTQTNFYNNPFRNKWSNKNKWHNRNKWWAKKNRLYELKVIRRLKKAQRISKKRAIHLAPQLTFNTLVNQFLKQVKLFKHENTYNIKNLNHKALFEKNKISLIKNKALFKKTNNNLTNNSSFTYKSLLEKNKLTTRFSMTLPKINVQNLSLGLEEALLFSLNSKANNQFIINLESLVDNTNVFLNLKKHSQNVEIRFTDSLGFAVYERYIVDTHLFNSILVTRSFTNVNTKKKILFKNHLVLEVSLTTPQSSSVKIVNEFFKTTSLKGFHYSLTNDNVLLAQTIIFKLLLTSNEFRYFLSKHLSSNIKSNALKTFKFHNKVYSQFLTDNITGNQNIVNSRWLKNFTNKAMIKSILCSVPKQDHYSVKKLLTAFVKLLKFVKKSNNLKLLRNRWFFPLHEVCSKLKTILGSYSYLYPLLTFKKRKFRINKKSVPVINSYINLTNNSARVDLKLNYFVRNLISLPSRLFTQKILVKAFRQTYKLVKKKAKPFNWKRRFWRNIRLAYKLYFYTRTYNFKKKQKLFEFKKVIKKKFKFKRPKRSSKNRKLLQNVWYINRDLNGKRSRMVSNFFVFDKNIKLSSKIKRSRKAHKRSYKKRTYQNFTFSERGKWKSLKGRYLRRLKLKQYFFQFYGNLQWRQFHKVFNQVRKRRSHRTQNWLFNFEKRLHTLLFRLKIASTSGAARQLIQHGHVMVHNKKITRKNYVVKDTDLLFYINDRLNEKINLKPYKFSNLYRRQLTETPSYLNLINLQIPTFARMNLLSNEETFNWLNTSLKQDVYKKLQSFWSTKKINISQLAKQTKVWKYDLPAALQDRFKTEAAFKDKSIYFRLNRWKTRRGAKKQVIFFRTARRFKRWQSHVSKTLLKLKKLSKAKQYNFMSQAQVVRHSNLHTNKNYIYKLKSNFGKLQLSNTNKLYSLRKNSRFYPKLRRRFKYMRYLRSVMRPAKYDKRRLTKKFKSIDVLKPAMLKIATIENTAGFYKRTLRNKRKKYSKISKHSKYKKFKLMSISTKDNKEINFSMRVKKTVKIKARFKKIKFKRFNYRKTRFGNQKFKKRPTRYSKKKRKEMLLKKRSKQKTILNLIKKRTFLSQKSDKNYLLLQYKRKQLMKHNRVQARRRRKMYKIHVKQHLSLKTKMRRWLKSQYKKKSFFWERELVSSKYSKFLKLFKKKIKKKKFLKNLYRGWAFKQIYFFFNSKKMEFLRKKLKSSLFCWRKKQVLKRQVFQNASLRLFIGFLSPLVTQRIMSSYSETSFTPFNGLNEIKWYA